MKNNKQNLLTYEQKKNAFLFIFITFMLMISFGIGAFYYQKKKNPDLTIKEFVNGGKEELTARDVFISMSFGFIFGFIDNSSLWLGMEHLGPIFAKYLPGNLTNAGLGNAYGDFLGSSFGTFIALMLSLRFPTKNFPIWADCIGVTIGCLLGVFIPRALSSKK